MSLRNSFIIILILISPSVIFRLEAAGDTCLIRLHDCSSVVAIDDILNRESGKLSEGDVKRICAEITDRFHERGYTAFYIKKAVLNKDGTVDLFFNEAVVSDVIVTGISSRTDEVAASIFIKGKLFNENTLKENLAGTKKKYNIKQLNVSIRRGDGQQIVLTAHAVEKIHEIETGILNSPIYGILPGLKYRINYGGFLAGISLGSSFNQNDRSYSGGSVFFNTDSTPGNSYFTISADLTDKKNSFYENDELIYRHKSLTSKGGYCYNNGAAGIRIFLTGTADELDDYPETDGGISFAGSRLELNYNDTPYKIDFDDISSGEIDILSGWNFIEESPSLKVNLNYIFNIPVYSGFFFSFNGNFFYTSDEERLSHSYVFDQYLPCRENDYSSAPWENVAGFDIVYEAMKRTVFILPGIKWGFYNADGGDDNIYAAGIKSLFTSGRTKIELSYFYDMEFSIKKGFLMFSAAAVY